MANFESLEKLVLDLTESMNRQFDGVNARLERMEKEMGGFRKLLVATSISYGVWVERVTDLQTRDIERDALIQKLTQRVEALERKTA